MFNREMFRKKTVISALRNNVDYITLILSLISAILFLAGSFIVASVTSGGFTVTTTVSVFAAVGYCADNGAVGVSVFLVIFIIIDFVLLFSCLFFIAVRFLTEIDVFSDKLEVRLAAMTLSPAKLIAISGTVISLITMIMGGVCAANFYRGSYTGMVAAFVVSAVSLLLTFGIPFFVGKSKRYAAHSEKKVEPAREEYTENHGWNGTENFNNEDEQ